MIYEADGMGEGISYEEILDKWYPEGETELTNLSKEDREKKEKGIKTMANFFLENFFEGEEMDFSLESIKEVEKVLTRENRDAIMEASDPSDTSNEFRLFADFAGAYVGETLIKEILMKGINARWKFFSPPARSQIEFERGGDRVIVSPFDMVLKKLADEKIDDENYLSARLKSALEWAK